MKLLVKKYFIECASETNADCNDGILAPARIEITVDDMGAGPFLVMRTINEDLGEISHPDYKDSVAIGPEDWDKLDGFVRKIFAELGD